MLQNLLGNLNTLTKQLDIIYTTVKNSIIDQGLVFFGGYALYTYSKYLSTKERSNIVKSPDFDVLALDAKIAAEGIKEKLQRANINDVNIINKPGIGEIIAPHYAVRIGEEIVAFIYTPLACHSL